MMKQTTEEAILPIKVLELARIVADKKRMSLSDALFYLYNSVLYHDLLDPDLKLWYYSGVRLYELLEEEKWRAKRDITTSAKEQFLVFCIEQYRLRDNIASATVLELFIASGLRQFLMEHFEVLHSQGTAYILHEIDAYLRKRKKL